MERSAAALFPLLGDEAERKLRALRLSRGQAAALRAIAYLSDGFRSPSIVDFPHLGCARRSVRSALLAVFWEQTEQDAFARAFPATRPLLLSPGRAVPSPLLVGVDIRRIDVARDLALLPTPADGNCGYHCMLQSIVEAYLFVQRRAPPRAVLSLLRAVPAVVGCGIDNARRGAVRFPREAVDALRGLLLRRATDAQQRKRVALGRAPGPVPSQAWMQEADLLLVNALFRNATVCVCARGHGAMALADGHGDVFAAPHVSLVVTDGVHFQFALPRLDAPLPGAAEYLRLRDERLRRFAAAPPLAAL